MISRIKDLEDPKARSVEGEQHHLEDVTVATERKRLSGGGGRMGLELFAMHVDFITPN